MPALEPLHAFDLRRLETAPGLSLLVVTSVACGACRAIRRAIGELSDGVVDRVFEVDAGESPGLVADLEIFHLPALFLYVDGDYHAPVHSEPLPGPLARAITAARLGPAQSPP